MAQYVLELCTNNELTVTVDSGATTLFPGQIVSFFNEEGSGSCGTVVEGTPSTPVYSLGSLYEFCNDCLNATPYQVNPPEYTLCVKDCDGNLVELTLPHPVWTNNYGAAVTQLNAVTLGGVNGLNN